MTHIPPLPDVLQPTHWFLVSSVSVLFALVVYRKYKKVYTWRVNSNNVSHWWTTDFCASIHLNNTFITNIYSGGARTPRQPGHFQVTKDVRQDIRRQYSKGARSFWGQKILKPGHPMHFFLKKVDDLFSRRPQNRRQGRWLFHSQNKTNKAVRYGNIFIFCLHYYWSKAIGRAEPERCIFQPGHLIWRALA